MPSMRLVTRHRREQAFVVAVTIHQFRPAGCVRLGGSGRGLEREPLRSGPEVPTYPDAREEQHEGQHARATVLCRCARLPSSPE